MAKPAMQRPVVGLDLSTARRAMDTEAKSWFAASRRFFFFDLPVAQWNFTTNADDETGELSV